MVGLEKFQGLPPPPRIPVVNKGFCFGFPSFKRSKNVIILMVTVTVCGGRSEEYSSDVRLTFS